MGLRSRMGGFFSLHPNSQMAAIWGYRLIRILNYAIVSYHDDDFLAYWRHPERVHPSEGSLILIVDSSPSDALGFRMTPLSVAALPWSNCV